MFKRKPDKLVKLFAILSLLLLGIVVYTSSATFFKAQGMIESYARENQQLRQILWDYHQNGCGTGSGYGDSAGSWPGYVDDPFNLEPRTYTMSFTTTDPTDI